MLEKMNMFMVSKPLQYVNATNIECNEKRTLLLIDSFHDAKKLFDVIKKEEKCWVDVIMFSEKKDAFNWLLKNIERIDNLYVDADVGYRSYFYQLRKIKIFVYEEGIGTYIPERRKFKNSIIPQIYKKAYWSSIYYDICWFLYGIIGYKDRIGGDRYTYGLILYYPEFYSSYIKDNKKKLYSFKEEFLTALDKNQIKKIFSLSLEDDIYYDKVVLLYLTSWVPIEGLENIKGFDLKIIKPHPNIKEYKFDGYDFCVPAYVMSEYVIMELLKSVKKLIIVSSCSSSVIHFHDDPKIIILNAFDFHDVNEMIELLISNQSENNIYSKKCFDVFNDIIKYKKISYKY